MIIMASDRITALAAVVAAAGAGAGAGPARATEATHIKGKWMLKGQTEATGDVALSIDRYVCIQAAYVGDESGEIRFSPYAHGVYLTSEAVQDLRHHLDGLWQCPKCDYWMRGAGICCLCSGEG